jgi:hypothetical protein
MNNNLRNHDIHTLKEMYEKEASALKAALISGISWDDLKDKRQVVTDLAIAIHQKRFPMNVNPAESGMRDR